MKSIRFMVSTMMVVILVLSACSQTPGKSQATVLKTETIPVSGNCEMCKTRIEEAATIEGVSKAEWNKETKILTLTYDASEVTAGEVQKKIAASGHDTGKYLADNVTYDSLPACCKYR